MYILYVLSAIVPSDFFSIEFLLIFYNNCLGFEIISDTQKGRVKKRKFFHASFAYEYNSSYSS